MILDLFKLDGKVAVVTGANTGLGQGMAVALAEAGAKVVGVGRRFLCGNERKVLKHLAEALQRYWQICQQPQR